MSDRTASTHLISPYDQWAGHAWPMDIATKITKARAEKGWSQRDLAKKMRVAQGAVGQWETRETKPLLKNRAKLAEVLNIPFAELLPEAGEAAEMLIHDRQTLQLVEHFLKLPAPMRTAVVMNVVALVEATRRDP